jgi:hypothetical protein
MRIPTIFRFPLVNFRCRTKGPFSSRDEAENLVRQLNDKIR